MKRPLIWGHRGASGYAPENTLPAFKMAADMGAEGVELDVQLTKDGVLVVCHDEQVDRTSSGAGWIKDLTFDDLRKLDFSNGNRAYEGVQIPTMEEVYDLLEPTGLTINIELKTGIVFYENIEEKLLALTEKKGWKDRVIYSSFNHYTIMKIKQLDPEAKTGFLYGDGPLDMAEYGSGHGVTALHPALYNLQFPGFVEEAHSKGLQVNTWTVNEKDHMLLCGKLGVDAIITNYPEKAFEVYKEAGFTS